MDDFLWRALGAGIGIAFVAGPLGCFIVWRRMAYFGDTLAHSALLGVALGMVLNLNLNVAAIIVCVLIALLLVLLQKQQHLATDTVLGILAHSALSLGLVSLAFIDNLNIDLMSFLFGDLLAVTPVDLYWVYGGGSLVLLILIGIWQALLSLTVHEQLAQVEGIAMMRTQLLFVILVALMVAVSMKIIGILLITSLLIIPPAAARYFARSPEQMAILASFIGCLAVIIGLSLSWHWDTPAGPSVVVAATGLFSLAALTRFWYSRVQF